VEVVLALLIFVSFAYFYQGGGANQNARLDQIRSIVELGQLNLKPFAGSHDIVQVGSKTYPNKAPGISLIGVVPYYLISRLKPVVVRWWSADTYQLLSCYLVTVLVVGITGALGSVVFFRLLGLFHPGVGPRLICTLGLFLGTPAFAYSTVLYGHMVSAILSVISFYLLYKYLCVRPDAPRASLFIFLAGLAGGWAVVTEYPVLVIVTALSFFCYFMSLVQNRRKIALTFLLLGVFLFICAIFLSWWFQLWEFISLALKGKISTPVSTAPVWLQYGVLLALSALPLFSIISLALSGRISGRFALFLAGILPPALVLLLYNYLVFENWLFVAYFDKRAAAHAAYRQGALLGFSLRSPQLIKALYQTSFGPFRGFFHLSPFLILIFPGIFYFGRVKGKKGLLITLWLLVIIYFFLNTIYPYWYGGRALGPRHAMEMLPYLCILAFFFMVRFPRFTLLLMAVSIFFMLAATSVRPEEYATHPFRGLYFPNFLSGNLSINTERTFQSAAFLPRLNSFNLGELLGLRGQFSLLPLYIIWLIGGFIMSVFAQKQYREAGETTPSLWGKVTVILLCLMVGLQIVNLAYQLKISTYLEDLSDAGEYRLPASEAPVAAIQAGTSPGHRLQVWEVLAPYDKEDTIKIKIQHAAAGTPGGFHIVAFIDKNGDGQPDTQLSASPFLKAKHAKDWSYWTFPAPEGKVFVGNSWREGGRVFFERSGWKNRQFSSQMFYSQGGAPKLSTGPRSTNMAVEIMEEE